MFCSKCGQQNDDTAQFCSSCGNMLHSNTAVRPQQQPCNNTPISLKSKGIAAILAFFLGCWGGHWFYLNQVKKGIIMLVIGFFGLFLILPLIVTGIWSLIDFITILCMSDNDFNNKYNTPNTQA